MKKLRYKLKNIKISFIIILTKRITCLISKTLTHLQNNL